MPSPFPGMDPYLEAPWIWPVIKVPLRGKEPEVPLDLGAVFRTVYDRAAYDVSVDYRKPPQPPLEGGDAKWARELLRGAVERGTHLGQKRDASR